ncbi:hypothetical protein [Natranaerobius trueperi]|uniref:Uncharacterized protein n=1 Tax=Natranaerobius trueperi TaxID=759412 RepID=A0A226BXG2_9FIRM|nr:hypothetical protein [Natranaerobius trueperi]OWZ83713.1 hypothetical protein CDO51_07100 [Natranaerobius trueperi]
MRKILILLLFVSSVMFVGCQDEELINDMEEYVTTIDEKTYELFDHIESFEIAVQMGDFDEMERSILKIDQTLEEFDDLEVPHEEFEDQHLQLEEGLDKIEEAMHAYLDVVEYGKSHRMEDMLVNIQEGSYKVGKVVDYLEQWVEDARSGYFN